MGLQYPQRLSESVIFRENLINDDYVSSNGGVKTGDPVIDNGATLNGSTQFIELPTLALNGQDEIVMVVRFNPDLAYDADERIALFSTDDQDFYAYKNNNAGSNALVYRFGGVTLGNVSEGTYGQYWNVGEENLLIFSSNGSSTNGYLNGNKILTNDPTAWTPMYTSTEVSIGRLGPTPWYFTGKYLGVDVLNRHLTDQEALDIYNKNTFTSIDVSKNELSLNLRSYYNNGSFNVTENIGNAGDVYWGDGAGAGEPTLLEDNGVDFSSGNVYLKKPVPISLDSVNDKLTVGCLVYLNNNTSTQAFMENEENWLFSYVNTFGIGLQMNDGGGAYHSYSLGGTPPVGKWCYLTAVYDGSAGASGFKSYIDGVEQTSALSNWDGGITNNSTSLALGIRATTYSSSALDGKMKFPFVKKAALTPTQIKELSNNAFARLNI